MATACACCGESANDAVSLLCHPAISICSRCLDWLVEKRDKQERARGGWRVEGFEPIFGVADLAGSINHYAAMGFAIEQLDGSNAFAHRDRGLTIHLAQGASRPTAGALYIHCDDADALAQEWRKAGLEVTGPQDYDYGMREGSHHDHDPNRIRFGSPIRSDPD
ncbi:MAG: hypothetical protein ACRDV6_09710 [Acidimicrobiales bacterium]